jgi:hypothetical protein
MRVVSVGFIIGLKSVLAFAKPLTLALRNGARARMRGFRERVGGAEREEDARLRRRRTRE